MEENSSLFSLSLDTSTKTQLSGAVLWARLFAIAGILLLAIAFVKTIYSMYVLSRYDLSGSYLTAERIGSIAGYLLVYLIPIFALIFILRFSTKLKMALQAEDQRSLMKSFQNLKIYFRYMAILTIILVVILTISWLAQLGKGY